MIAVATLSVAERFALTLDGLCRAVAARIAGRALAAAMIVLIWGRVRRIEGRILRLLARFRAGRLWVRGARGSLSSGRAGRKAGARLPVGFGWLLALVPYEAAGYAGQVRTLLVEPEMVALLAASPQARRVMKPLCRMLGVEASLLEPTVVVRREVRVSEAPAVAEGDWVAADPDGVWPVPRATAPPGGTG